MKILIIGPFSPPISGVSFSNETLIRNLRAQGILCDTINTNTPIVSSRQGTSFSSRKAFAFIRTYLYAYKIFSCNLVYLTPGQTFFGVVKYAPFLLASLISGKPYVIHVHGNYLGKEYSGLSGLKKKIFHYLLSNAKAGIVLSASLVQNFDGLLKQEKIFIVRNFVDSSLYDQALATKKSDKVRLLYLSSLMREKGILEVLDALIELKDKVDFKAIIAGTMEEGIGDDVKKRFLKLGDKVEYIGTVTGSLKKKALTDSNVFILPTYYTMEGQPISLLEALATGNIIITTSHAGIPDIINETNGFFIESRSSQAIADCVVDISQRLMYYVDKFALHNVSYAASAFTEERFSQEILYVFEKAVKAEHTSRRFT